MADTDIQVLRNRHFAIMDTMIAHPSWTLGQVAESLNYNEKYLGEVTRSTLFQTAFKEYRRKYEAALRESIVEATKKAIATSVEIFEDRNKPDSIRQVSIKDILDQGHAKAIDKKASLNMDMEIPAELLPRMEAFMKEATEPFVPKKIMERPDESEELEARNED